MKSIVLNFEIKGVEQSITNFDELHKSIAETNEDLKDIENTSNSIDKTTEKTKTLKQQLKEMKNELLNLDEGSEEFKKMAIEASELEDRIGDVNSRVKAFASDTKKLDTVIGSIQGIGASFQAVTGVMALMGGESENLQKAMQKIVIVQGILNGVNEVARILNKEHIVGAQIRIAIDNAQAATTGKLTLAQKILNQTMKANPVFLLIGGFTALAAAFSLFSDNASASERAQKKLNEAMEAGDKAAAKEITQIQRLTVTITNVNAGYGNKKKAVEDLVAIAPEYLEGITLENIGTQESIDKIKQYIKLSSIKAEVQALEAQLQESISARLTLMRKKEQGTIEDLSFSELTRLTVLAEEESAIKGMIATRQMQIDSINKESSVNAMSAKAKIEITEREKKETKEKADNELSLADRNRLAIAELNILTAKTFEEKKMAEIKFLEIQNEIKLNNEKFTAGEILLINQQLNDNIKRINDELFTYMEMQNATRLDNTKIKIIDNQKEINDSVALGFEQFKIQQKKANEFRISEEKASNDALLAARNELHNATFNAASNAIGALSSLAGKNEKLANTLFITEKALAIGKVIVDTIKSNAAVTAAQAIKVAELTAIPLGAGLPFIPAAISAFSAIKNANRISAAGSIAALAATTFAKFKTGSSSASVSGGGGETASSGGAASSGGGASAPITAAIPSQQLFGVGNNKSNVTPFGQSTQTPGAAPQPIIIQNTISAAEMTTVQNDLSGIQSMATLSIRG